MKKNFKEDLIMKDFKDITNVAVGGIVCIVGVVIYKKLKDIHEEIIYFEDKKGIWNSKKKSDRKYKKWLKEKMEKTES